MDNNGKNLGLARLAIANDDEVSAPVHRQANDASASGLSKAIDANAISKATSLIGSLSAFDESSYVWDLATDTVEWSPNAASVFGFDDILQIATGQGFESRIVPEHQARRRAAIAPGLAAPKVRSIPYFVQYRFRPGALRGTATIWLEEHGQWLFGEDGRLKKASGTIRVVSESFVAEQAAQFGCDLLDTMSQLNRTRLPQALAAFLGRAEHRQGSSSFLMISVNNIAAINEAFGFEIGDEVLVAVGEILKSKLRSGDLLGRYSSDKFGVIVNNCGSRTMRIAAERFIKVVRDTPISTSACPINATISVGGVAIPECATTVQQVFTRSLQALDVARARRGDSFCAFEPGNKHETIRNRRITIADDILAALDEDRMRLVLQPLVNAKTRKADFYECLLRMQKPDGKLLSAGEFIPFAERYGLLKLIDRRTLELAVALLKQHPKLTLSLNVSGATTTDQDWLNSLRALTDNDRSLTRRLVLEITETNVIDDLDEAVAFVDSLRELGCRAAIDDFGAGFTSFKNLKHLPVDLVKIDGAFVKNLAIDSSDQIFVKTMVELAQSFGMETVAEWVGDEECADILTKAGITYLQGFYFGQPIRAEDLPPDL